MARKLFVPVEVDYYQNEKFEGLPETAEVLWVRALAYAKERRTDGKLTIGQLRFLGLDGLEERIQALCAAKLWNVVDGGWEISGFLKRNRSAAEIEEISEKRRKAGAKSKQSAEQFAQQNGSKQESSCDPEYRAEGREEEEVEVPPPLPPNAGGGTDGSLETEEAKDGTDTTATMIGQRVNELWRELGLGASRGYDWNLGAMKITALTQDFTEEEILSGVRKIARTPGLAWAGKRGPSYLATKKDEVWRLEIVLTWEDARRGAEAGPSGRESAAERAKRIVGAR